MTVTIRAAPFASRVVLAWLLAVTAVLKLFWPSTVGDTLIDSVGLSPTVLGTLELIAALLLLSDRGRRYGIILCSTFLAAMGVALVLVGRQALADCGCLGSVLRLTAFEHGALLVLMSTLLLMATRAVGEPK